MKIFLLYFLLCFSLSAKNPTEIFKEVEPSIVLIGTEESSGSGVIISANGLILTNYHVVNTPLDLRVKAKCLINGELKEKEFKDVELVKVHKNYDLALIQIKGDSKFKPMSIDNGGVVKQGIDCYAVGNPAYKNSILRNTITEGKVTQTEAVFEKLKYIQTSAPINPGNSGGALVDSKGKLIGIVTFKITNVKNAGFAIPSRLIKTEDFVKAVAKKDNLEAADKYVQKGTFHAGTFTEINPIYQDRKAYHWFSALYNYRLAMLEAPNSMTSYYNSGLLFFNIKEYEIAKVYFDRAARCKDRNSDVYSIMGSTMAKLDEKEDGLSYYLKGTWFKKKGWELACVNAGAVESNNSHFLSSLYMYKLASLTKLYKSDDKITQKVKTLSMAIENKKAVTAILAKNKIEDFSEKEYLKIRRLDETLKKSQNSGSLNITGDYSSRLKKLTDSMIPGKEEWHQTLLQGHITDHVSTYDGLIIAAKLKWQKKVLIYNVSNFKTATLPVKSEDYFLSAANGILFLYYRELNQIIAYDILSLKELSRSSLPYDIRVDLFKMGSDNHTKALIQYRRTNQTQLFLGIIDLQKKTIVDISVLPEKRVVWYMNIYDNFLVDKNLNSFLFQKRREYFELNSTTGECRQINLAEWTKESAAGTFTLSAGGMLLGSDKGNYINKTSPVSAVEGKWSGSEVYFSLNDEAFIEVNQEQIAIRDSVNTSVTSKFTFPPALLSNENKKGSRKFDKIFYSAATGRFCLAAGNKVFVKVIKKVEKNILSIQRGQTWSYQINIPANSKVTLEAAPEGMKLVNGNLVWKVPPDEDPREEEILLLYKTDGKEDFKSIKLKISE